MDFLGTGTGSRRKEKAGLIHRLKDLFSKGSTNTVTQFFSRPLSPAECGNRFALHQNGRHFIVLNEAGETIEDLEAEANQAKLEATLKQWTRSTIKQIEDRRGASDQTAIRA